MRALNIVLVVVFLVAAPAAAQVTVRPGQYEVTLDLDLGIPKDAPKAVLDAAGFKNDTKLECFTPPIRSRASPKGRTTKAERQRCGSPRSASGSVRSDWVALKTTLSEQAVSYAAARRRWSDRGEVVTSLPKTTADRSGAGQRPGLVDQETRGERV